MLANVIAMIVLMQVVPTLPALPSPTPYPTTTPIATIMPEIPHSEIYNFLSTAVVNVNNLPEDLFAPGGVPVLVNPDAQAVFSYGKWMLSVTGARELVGDTLSPIAVRIFLFLSLTVVFSGIWQIVNLVVLLIKGIVYIVQQVLKFIPFVGAFAFQFPPTPTAYPVPPVAPITVPNWHNVWSFADDGIQQWNRFGSGPTQVIQIGIIVMIIFAALMFIRVKIKSMSNDGEAAES